MGSANWKTALPCEYFSLGPFPMEEAALPHLTSKLLHCLENNFWRSNGGDIVCACSCHSSTVSNSAASIKEKERRVKSHAKSHGSSGITLSVSLGSLTPKSASSFQPIDWSKGDSTKVGKMTPPSDYFKCPGTL